MNDRFPSPDGFRCSVASEDDGEPLAGTAPTETDWLLVEDAGPWAAKATAGLDGDGARVQLVRRFGRSSAGEHRARLSVPDGGATAYLLVCTNGRRDVCCAERGRPVTAALAERWPEATWETTHLGGHRFAATLVAFPWGVALGRVDPTSAVAAVEELHAGRLPLEHARGRVGWPARAQYADLVLRREHGWTGLDDVRLVGVEDDVVTLATPSGPLAVTVARSAGVPRRQSCADERSKPASVFALQPPRSSEGLATSQ